MSSDTKKLTALTVAEAAEGLARGDFDAVGLANAALERIDALDGQVNAFRTVDRDGALAAARASDERRAKGQTRGTLDGIPISLKDNLMTRGLATTCSSRMLENFVPPYDATAVIRLRAAGAVPLGKTNLDEFAMGSTSEYCAWGPVRNPWNHGHAAGGSSGGAAAATAYGGGLAALGSDTGGSVRTPASFCGVVGTKPTYGRVSRNGLGAMASSLDQIGPVARSVRDSAILLDAIAGYDPLDATSRDRPAPDCVAAVDRADKAPADAPLAGARLGWLPACLDDSRMHPEIATLFRSVLNDAKAGGAELVELEMPRLPYGVAAYYLISASEICANMARFDGFRYGHRGAGRDWIASSRRSRGESFGREVKRRILIGAYALSAGYRDAYYLKAARVRRLLTDDFNGALARCDALLMPVNPMPPPRLGEWTGDPLTAYLADVFTVPANLTGLPALAFPAGMAAGLPAGAQLIGRAWEEARLHGLARAFERLRPFSRNRNA